VSPIALCQGSLTPELLLIDSPPPADNPFYGYVFFYANPGAKAFNYTQVSVAGNVITATFDANCFTTCVASDVGYWSFFVQFPALPAGNYTLRILDPSDPNKPDFTLTVGAETATFPPPQLATLPVLPHAGQPFKAYAYFAPPVLYYGPYQFDDISVVGNTIIAPLRFTHSCPWECPASVGYGPYILNIPALSHGDYTLNIVDALTPTTVLAQYPLAIGLANASTDSAPAIPPKALWLLIALILLPAWITLRRTLNGNPRC